MPSDRTDVRPDHALLFGAFCLRPAQQLLLEEDKPLRIGGRALDILTTLVENAGELVTKNELVDRVWPNSIVDEANLRTQIGLLRRALGDGHGGARYVVTVPGRGYRFVAPVMVVKEPGAAVSPVEAEERRDNLPIRLSRTIGRVDCVTAVGSRLARRRFVTIVGAGGIGKTTVALAVGTELTDLYPDGIFLADLSPLTDPSLIPTLLVSVLGLEIVSEDLLAGLIVSLLRKRILLVLDSCEHLVEPIAVLAEKLLRAVPNLHILATSREPLRAEGEALFRLQPLETPPARVELTAEGALAFSAVQLFVERATSNDETFEFGDAEAPVVAEICRKLDGMPLAIELAAGRVDTFGVHGLASHLDDRFRLLLSGRRTALPRHQSLAAALDWSYRLISERERTVLRRLAVFAGDFTLEAAEAVARGDEIQPSDVVRHIADLVAKSLVAADIGTTMLRYRLLDTMRVYAAEKLDESGEFTAASRRQAEYYKALLDRAGAESETRPLAEWLAAYGWQISNVRKALDWTFSPGGDATLGIELTVASLPLWMHFSLMSECRLRVETALSSLVQAEDRDPRNDMRLFHALGAVLLNIEASGPAIVSALTRALEIAESLDEIDYQLRALWCLWCHGLNRGAFREALDLADRFRAVAPKSSDPVDVLTGERMRGFVLHFLGDQEQARRHIEYMISRYVAPDHRAHIVRFQFDQLITARITLVQILWIQGSVDQSSSLNETNIADAHALNHTLSLCNALAKASCPVSLMAGDLPAAERFIGMLLNRSARHGLAMWHSWGNCFRAILLIKQGAAAIGLRLLDATLANLPENRFSLRYTWVLGERADGLRKVGRLTEGFRTIEAALERSEQDEERWCVSELLRIKAELFLAQGGAGDAENAERLFLQAIDWSHRQGALSWELRTAIGLSRMWNDQGRVAEAHKILASTYGRFTEGYDTTDMKFARIALQNIDKSMIYAR